eukprot:CAMPEP_0206422252 /NCGR_PEP_ID=MMETSP0324_2-20121206/1964_1 /ASSEMBLY_ACC=CAM_ASM_000836 /TAXON_ID=2866 /ORGANISM="Crypthecodinium cohnii, Strain Seligo" /LENGTH=333 /DNA_ID=CAMNT_0053886565 /DNA_START=39 /DNA_END=1037 /DNA_ORIENTATION=+
MQGAYPPPYGVAASSAAGSRVVNHLLCLRERLAEWLIEPEDLVKEDMPIGDGSTSVVYKGCFSNITVAIKEYCLQEMEEQFGHYDEATILAVTRELEVWPMVEHPHILKFVGICFSNDLSTLQICSQYCAGGTLFDLLHNNWCIVLSNRQKLQILIDLASAVDHLHKNRSGPVIHRDLKSLNVFLLNEVKDETSEVKVMLADFGFARISPDRAGWSDLTSGVGTPHWMAPEVSQGRAYHTTADVFSFAVIMYEVLCRRMFFENSDSEEVQSFVAQGRRPPLFGGSPEEETLVPDDVPRELRDLVARCWSHNPAVRPSMGTVLLELGALMNHPW